MLKLKTEDKEVFISQSLELFQEYYRPSTGFVHYSKESEQHDQFIPIFENLCFVVALLRSHQLDQLALASEVLSKLLHFQTAEGAFPDYLHQYPYVAKQRRNFHYCLPLLIIYRFYHSLLNEDLQSQLKKSMDKLYIFLSGLEEKVEGLNRVLNIFSYFLNNSPIDPSIFTLEPVGSSKELGLYLLLMQQLHNTPYEELAMKACDQVFTYIDAEKKIYIGPLLFEKYSGNELLPSILDYILFGCTTKSPSLFLAPLIIFPIQPKSVENQKRYKTGRFVYRYVKQQNACLTFLEEFIPDSSLPLPKAFQTFRLLTSAESSISCFPEQIPTSIQIEGNQVLFLYHYTEPFDVTQNQREEVSFYLSKHKDTEVLVNATKASCFYEDDQVTLRLGTLKVHLGIKVKNGEGKYIGGVMFAPRSNNICSKSADYKITIRTVKRDPQTTLVISLMMTELENLLQDPWSEAHCLHRQLSL